MKCEEAQKLFQVYLDGELSSSLATELAAHRVKCADCRRALALMEVAGHIVAIDAESAELGAAFSDKLLACMESPPSCWSRRLRRAFYLGVPAAAAAVVALAFLGVFDRDTGGVAGVQVTSEVQRTLGRRPPKDLVERAQENLASKRKSVESLQSRLDLTIGQILDILNDAQSTPGIQSEPGANFTPVTDTQRPPASSGLPADVLGDQTGTKSETPSP